MTANGIYVTYTCVTNPITSNFAVGSIVNVYGNTLLSQNKQCAVIISISSTTITIVNTTILPKTKKKVFLDKPKIFLSSLSFFSDFCLGGSIKNDGIGCLYVASNPNFVVQYKPKLWIRYCCVGNGCSWGRFKQKRIAYESLLAIIR